MGVEAHPAGRLPELHGELTAQTPSVAVGKLGGALPRPLDEQPPAQAFGQRGLECARQELEDDRVVTQLDGDGRRELPGAGALRTRDAHAEDLLSARRERVGQLVERHQLPFVRFAQRGLQDCSFCDRGFSPAG